MITSKKIHFISIGGSIMHSLAINLKLNGNMVTGSDDKIYDPSKSQLKKHKGNISKTAEFIGMERSALHRKLKSLGIKGIN